MSSIIPVICFHMMEENRKRQNRIYEEERKKRNTEYERSFKYGNDDNANPITDYITKKDFGKQQNTTKRNKGQKEEKRPKSS